MLTCILKQLKNVSKVNLLDRKSTDKIRGEKKRGHFKKGGKQKGSVPLNLELFWAGKNGVGLRAPALSLYISKEKPLIDDPGTFKHIMLLLCITTCKLCTVYG